MSRSKRTRAIAILCVSLACAVGAAGAAGAAGAGDAAQAPALTAAQPKAALPSTHVNLEQTRLENGLRVITVEDRRAPVISVALVYDVGSANEHRGRTGFAHLFEHLMFQGSENVEPGKHISVVANYGGISNAMTTTDYTLYFDSVPSNQLDLALFLNADRLRSLSITQANFTKEKEVVKEERRLRIDNQPYRQGALVLNGLLYDSFAYAHDGIGSMADLDASSLEDIRNFFNTYYTAGNVVLALVGDFDSGAALSKVRQYFGDLPARAAPPPADRTEPPQKQARRKVIEDPLAPAPRLSLAFKAVPGNHPDFFALQVLSAALQDGHSSRLQEALLKRRELATEVSGYVDELRGPGGLYVTATLRPTSTIEEVEKTIYQEIERLQQRPIASWELEKAKSSIAASYLEQLHRTVIRAYYIARYSIDFDDPNRINTYLDRIGAVTAKDVQRVARTYLRASNRTVVVTLPKKTGEGS